MRIDGSNGIHESPRGFNGASSGSGPGLMDVTGTASGSTNGKATSNGHLNGTMGQAGSDLTPTFYGHDREEVTRILIQGLHDLGYAGAASRLSQESGFRLETLYASEFRHAVTSGDWTKAEDLLLGTAEHDEATGDDASPSTNGHAKNGAITKRDSVMFQPGLPLSEDADQAEMLFLVKRQKYLELLEDGKVQDALAVLQQELQPLHQDERQLHALSSLIMCTSSEDLRYQAEWDGAGGQSRKQLLSELSRSISPSVMIPEHRLANLLAQVKDQQVLNCLYHNTAQWPSLYHDHHCERDDLPLETLKELTEHQNEVWHLAFSHDGTKLATASKDCKVHIYETEDFKLVRILSQHADSVAYVSWSPDDSRLVTCSKDKKARIWKANSGICLGTLNWHYDCVTTAAWSADSMSFATGSLDAARPLSIWSRDHATDSPLHTFTDCARVQDVAITAPYSRSLYNPDGDTTSRPARLIAVCVDKSVNIFDYAGRKKLSRIVLDYDITCLSISSDGLEMLVNLGCCEVWAMGLEDGAMRQRFKGQKQSSNVIRSCFGGASEGFVVSGGEGESTSPTIPTSPSPVGAQPAAHPLTHADAKISIWHRHTGRLLEKFSAHLSGCVNAVAWNPTKPGMFASVGDDRVVRIWAKPQEPSRPHTPLSPTAPQLRLLSLPSGTPHVEGAEDGLGSPPPLWSSGGGGRGGQGDGAMGLGGSAAWGRR